MSESQIGWVAPTLERAEYVLRVQGDWNRRLTYSGSMSDATASRELKEREVELFMDERSPTQIFKDQIFACFFSDYVGMKAIQDIDAIDNVMIEMDYPHTDSTWPNSLSSALEQVVGLTNEEQWKVLCGNAMHVHNFEPAFPVPAMAPSVGA